MTIMKTLYGDVEVGDGEGVSIEIHGPYCRVVTTHFAFGGPGHPIPTVRVVTEHVELRPPNAERQNAEAEPREPSQEFTTAQSAVNHASRAQRRQEKDDEDQERNWPRATRVHDVPRRTRAARVRTDPGILHSVTGCGRPDLLWYPGERGRRPRGRQSESESVRGLLEDRASVPPGVPFMKTTGRLELLNRLTNANRRNAEEK